jgi:hypothetical protein
MGRNALYAYVFFYDVIYGSFQTENNNLSLKKVVMYYDLESGD